MLRKVLNIKALDKMRNEDLYGDLLTVFKVIQTKCLQLAGQVQGQNISCSSDCHLGPTSWQDEQSCYQPPQADLNQSKSE